MLEQYVCSLMLILDWLIDSLSSRYKDTAALKAHGSSEKFQALQKKMADEGLMRAPMMLKMVAEKGGFKERL